MDTTRTRDEILALERKYWQAIQEEDTETALSLTDFPCLVVGPQGVGRVDRETYQEMMENRTYKIEDFEMKDDDAEVRLISEDVAVAAYSVRSKMMIEGNQHTVDASDCSVWIRRNGGWVCAAHTESILGDPFGRDQKSQADHESTDDNDLLEQTG